MRRKITYVKQDSIFNDPVKKGFPSFEEFLERDCQVSPKIMEPLRCNEYTRGDGWYICKEYYPVVPVEYNNSTRVIRKKYPVKKFEDIIRKTITSLGYEEGIDFRFNDEMHDNMPCIRLDFNMYFTIPYDLDERLYRYIENYFYFAHDLLREGRF